VKFGENLTTAPTPQATIRDADVVVFSAPAQHFRSALNSAIPYLTNDMVLVNVAKGIEQKTLKRMSEIADELLPTAKYVVLSDFHAEEVGQMPTTVSRFRFGFENISRMSITDRFGSHKSRRDRCGAGGVKDIIALAAGISGVGFGTIKRDGEMARLGLRGRRSITLGTHGHGDLITCSTCIPNRRCSILIGQG
jgi:glycerol-3-phosphate dehydrogenase (NAD(P)+)